MPTWAMVGKRAAGRGPPASSVTSPILPVLSWTCPCRLPVPTRHRVERPPTSATGTSGEPDETAHPAPIRDRRGRPHADGPPARLPQGLLRRRPRRRGDQGGT